MSCRILNHFLELVVNHAYDTNLLSNGPSPIGTALNYIDTSARSTTSARQKVKATIALLEMYQLTNTGRPGLDPSTVYPTLHTIIELLPEVLGNLPFPENCDDNLMGGHYGNDRLTYLQNNYQRDSPSATYGKIIELLREALA